MLPTTNTQINIRLPLSFIIFSLFSFLAAVIILTFQTDAIIQNTWRIPAIWMAAHLFIIGWALMIAMGVMYQLVPVVFLTSIWSEKLGFIQFGVTAIGITIFSITLGLFPKYALVGGLLTFIGILLFFIQMGITIRRQVSKNIITLFVGSALFYLFLTICIGIVLAWNLFDGFLGSSFSAFLKTHILFGISGWFTLLIIGFSYKLVPMFSLSHGFSMSLSPFVYITYNIGLALQVSSFFLENHFLFQLSILFLTIGFAIFTWHMKLILTKRIKKRLDRPFQFAILAIGIGLGIHVSVFIFSFFENFSTIFSNLIILFLIGWILFSIIGYLLKIVPFLWWTFKYSESVGKSDVPNLKEMISDRGSNLLFALLIASLIGFCLSFIFTYTLFLWLGLALILLTAILFIFNIIYILKR